MIAWLQRLAWLTAGLAAIVIICEGTGGQALESLLEPATLSAGDTAPWEQHGLRTGSDCGVAEADSPRRDRPDSDEVGRAGGPGRLALARRLPRSLSVVSAAGLCLPARTGHSSPKQARAPPSLD